MGPWASDQSEPTCEQLRQMWRQSKRHSRAAETTNEIPQYSDPFARASLDAYAAQILRPRPERRPVVYGRVQQSPPDKSLRPFDVLRRLNGRPIIKSDTVDPDDAAVLFSEEDKSPFVKATAKGSLQNLRDFVREEQGSLSASKGNFISTCFILIHYCYLDFDNNHKTWLICSRACRKPCALLRWKLSPVVCYR